MQQQYQLCQSTANMQVGGLMQYGGNSANGPTQNYQQTYGNNTGGYGPIPTDPVQYQQQGTVRNVHPGAVQSVNIGGPQGYQTNHAQYSAYTH